MATRNPNLTVLPAAQTAPCKAHLKKAHDPLVGARQPCWFTGLAPECCPGFDAAAGVLRSLPQPGLSSFTRRSVMEYFDNAWTLTELLFASLQGESTFTRPPYHQLRHPMMFYYGHPAVLYINKLRVAGVLEEGVDPFFEQLFETGVDEMSWDDLSTAQEAWPSVAQVTEYRRTVYGIMKRLIETHPCLEGGSAGWGDQAWAIFLGIEHERIHLETSSVLIRELPATLLVKPDQWPDYHPTVSDPSPAIPAAGADYPANPLLPVEAATVTLGKPYDYPSYGWDNEYGSRPVQVGPFKASKFKVTNGEFLEFVKAGGYSDASLWSKDGWGWRTFRNAKWPTFWAPDGPAGLHRYKLRLLFDLVPMRWDWPATVNFHEASAFAVWRTRTAASPIHYRLITEAEHMLLRDPRDQVSAPAPPAPPPHNATPASAVNGAAVTNGAAAAAGVKGGVAAALKAGGEDVAMLYGGLEMAQKGGFNMSLAWGSESPVGALGESSSGFADVMGNAWEWGEDHFAAFPGFRVHSYYDDFSAPCFGGEHQMIIGGSFISTGQLASKFARYQFRPHFFQHATFRLVLPQPKGPLPPTATPATPCRPFFQTSCMDGPPPYVGTGPCCTTASRRATTSSSIVPRAAVDTARLEATKGNYETDALMAQYLSLHFGPIDKVFSSFVRQGGILQDALGFAPKTGEVLCHWAKQGGGPLRRVLDLGCAVGGAAFEMTKVFDEVVGIDLSDRFIEAANRMKADGKIQYELQVEGDIKQLLTAELGREVDASRVTFMQGDACALPPSLGTFDAVLMANLLCRVPDPQACLDQVTALLAPGGTLMLTSPFTWMDAYTARSRWVGGTHTPDGEPVYCAPELKRRLAGCFEVLLDDQMPLVIRETSRKYQLILAHRLVLRKRA